MKSATLFLATDYTDGHGLNAEGKCRLTPDNTFPADVRRLSIADLRRLNTAALSAKICVHSISVNLRETVFPRNP
jgi:hypothetical protein